MRVIFDAARPGSLAPLRVVMLPAAYSAPEDFVRAGFIVALRERALEVDLVLASVELADVTGRTVLASIWRHLIGPARNDGCAVWLGGISLGGYLALCCAERHSAELAGLAVFAPYLGSHIVTGEVARAGGAVRWEPGELASDDDERRMWRFIKTLRSATLPVHLGLGSDDRFASRHRLMAAALAQEDVDTVSGGHDWPTWLRLWERFLDARLARAIQPGQLR
jgi:pimeloyl-ACP methyl ester carboxylesterase